MKKIIVIGLILIFVTSVFSGCVDDSKETLSEKQKIPLHPIKW